MRVLGGGVPPQERPEAGSMSADVNESVGSVGGVRRSEGHGLVADRAVAVVIRGLMRVPSLAIYARMVRVLGGACPPGEARGREYECRCQ